MKLFELEATIKLDSTDFATDLSNAVTDAQTLATEIDDLNTAPETTGKSSLSNVLGDATRIKAQVDDTKKTATDVDSQIEKIGTQGSSTLNTLGETFAGIAGALVETVVAGIFDIGAEAIEMAAADDSPLANAYNSAAEQLSLTQDIAKLSIGNALLPVATALKQFTDGLLSFVFRIDDADKLTAYLDQLETYEADNLKKVSENIRGVFAAFEEVKRSEPTTVADMQKGVESQTKYWEDYAAVMDSLSKKGVSADFLAEYADGSAQSLSYLQALDAASEQERSDFIASMEELSAAESAAATSINDAQVEVALAEDNVNATIADMVSRLDQQETAKLNMGNTMDAVVESISDRIPALRSSVETIKSLVNEIWSTRYMAYTDDALLSDFMSGSSPYYAVPGEVMQPQPKASGLGYVPYDGYQAELHRGEQILTRQQAEEYRSGESKTPGISQETLTAAFSAALGQWATPVSMDEMSGIISLRIGQSTRGRR